MFLKKKNRFKIIRRSIFLFKYVKIIQVCVYLLFKQKWCCCYRLVQKIVRCRMHMNTCVWLCVRIYIVGDFSLLFAVVNCKMQTNCFAKIINNLGTAKSIVMLLISGLVWKCALMCVCMLMCHRNHVYLTTVCTGND